MIILLTTRIFCVTWIIKIRGKKIKEKGKAEEKDEKEDSYFQEIIDVDENVTKDFEFLLNAPISEDDHFVFEAEKSWSIDISKYTEYFTLDLKVLSAAIESIPFNENVNIDTKYFTVSLTIFEDYFT